MRFRVSFRRILPLFLVAAIASPVFAQPDTEPTSPDLRGQSDCGDINYVLNDPRATGALDLALVGRFYAAHGAQCAWNAENAKGLMEVLLSSGDHGLSPTLFHVDALNWDRPATSPTSAAERDVLLSDAALKYASFVSSGLSGSTVPREDLAADHRTDGENIDGLMDSLYSDSVGEWLISLAPKYPAYLHLQRALVQYRGIAARGGWRQLPASLSLLKRRSNSYAELRSRLALEGDLSSDNGSARYDLELRQGLTRFQERNGLRADGILSKKTIERLNVSADERVAVIALNLERLRVSLRDMPATRIEVNLPAATAVLYREGRAHLAMNVVVGAPKHETPELSSVIDTIVLNPPWNVPRSIIENEIKPLLRKDRNYLKKNHMRWSGDQLVQEPGAHNALGRIKFDFPNRYSVYLHDTPARKLFTDPERAASHGCVRLERPLDLAIELLLGDSDWSREAVEAVIREGKTTRIALDDPMPVVIAYQTAFADEDGVAHFRTDIYGRDTGLTLKLAERVAELNIEPAQW